jgi:hypothetical protein
MKNSIILISLFLTFSQADYLNTKSTNQCIYNVQPYQNNKGLCYTKRSNNQNKCNKNLRYTDLINGYIYINNACVLSQDLESTGLDYNTYKSLQALNASLYGFTLTFLIGFLFILLGRR